MSAHVLASCGCGCVHVLMCGGSESGSMFANLPADISVFATTAADATSSSYACYFDQVGGRGCPRVHNVTCAQTLHTYLGDVYSVNWMQVPPVLFLLCGFAVHACISYLVFARAGAHVGCVYVAGL